MFKITTFDPKSDMAMVWHGKSACWFFDPLPDQTPTDFLYKTMAAAKRAMQKAATWESQTMQIQEVK